ncbi:ribbon-helix-helix protein, CopG family [Candidatus Woesearchaeota archaeon]|jgi:metal-responsive CopG/Arc/MetJ family transcriptional regulator|nr:ribbon-helix-helix protein, CopG family [Candidatus Woesearchaeota archaeon]MBT6519694.1 ribbon-helix-helix protein, CopG family [Candidatus Woesearchaeota archaeon]MBT7367385.1 ribbon-helix-helix protein, CopG family [Candidatus Woesearchaeota archaeon]
MHVVTVKFQENILEKIDKSIIENNFNSRTEFIREAVRDKLTELNREELINEFMKYRGKAKNKTSYEDNKRTKEIVSKELIEHLEKKFN